MNLISFYDNMIHLVDEDKTVGSVHMDSSETFDIVSHSILLGTLAVYRSVNLPEGRKTAKRSGQAGGQGQVNEA